MHRKQRRCFVVVTSAIRELSPRHPLVGIDTEWRGAQHTVKKILPYLRKNMAEHKGESSFPSAPVVRRLRREHIKYVADQLMQVVGKGLMCLQWDGTLSIEDVRIDDAEHRGLIISRLREPDLKKAVEYMEGYLSKSGYCHAFELTKFDGHPHFQLNYSIELEDDDSDTTSESETGSARSTRDWFSSDSESGDESDEEASDVEVGPEDTECDKSSNNSSTDLVGPWDL